MLLWTVYAAVPALFELSEVSDWTRHQSPLSGHGNGLDSDWRTVVRRLYHLRILPELAPMISLDTSLAPAWVSSIPTPYRVFRSSLKRQFWSETLPTLTHARMHSCSGPGTSYRLAAAQPYIFSPAFRNPTRASISPTQGARQLSFLCMCACVRV